MRPAPLRGKLRCRTFSVVGAARALKLTGRATRGWMLNAGLLGAAVQGLQTTEDAMNAITKGLSS